MRIDFASGLVSVALGVAGLGLPMVVPNSAAVGSVLLMVAGSFFIAAILMLLKDWFEGRGGGAVPAGPSASTTGDHSHSISGNHGPINIVGPMELGAPSAKPKHCPDMPIADALAAIAEAAGNDRDPFAEIRQAASDGRLTIWGRKEIPSQELSMSNCKWAEVRTAIPAGYWGEWRPIRDMEVMRSSDAPQTQREDGLVRRDRYVAMVVDENEVRRYWSKPRPWKADKADLGPNGWMA